MRFSKLTEGIRGLAYFFWAGVVWRRSPLAEIKLMFGEGSKSIRKILNDFLLLIYYNILLFYYHKIKKKIEWKLFLKRFEISFVINLFITWATFWASGYWTWANCRPNSIFNLFFFSNEITSLIRVFFLYEILVHCGFKFNWFKLKFIFDSNKSNLNCIYNLTQVWEFVDVIVL